MPAFLAHCAGGTDLHIPRDEHCLPIAVTGGFKLLKLPQEFKAQRCERDFEVGMQSGAQVKLTELGLAKLLSRSTSAGKLVISHGEARGGRVPAMPHKQVGTFVQRIRDVELWD